MEICVPAHNAAYTNREREKFGICKAKWLSFSPDFNPIERIWNWMREEIDGREEPVETVQAMRLALKETWDNLSIERINREIEKLLYLMAKCLSVSGNNNFPA